MRKIVRKSIKHALRSKSKKGTDIDSEARSHRQINDIQTLNTEKPEKTARDPSTLGSLQPITPVDRDISDFSSIYELKKHLTDCYEQKTSFHLNKLSPQQDILEFILGKINSDDTLSQFSDILSILKLIDQISSAQHSNFTEYNYFLNKILKNYEQKVSALLTKEQFSPTLETFFTLYRRDTKISSLRSVKGHINPFSNLNKVKTQILKMDKLYQIFSKIQVRNERQNSQAVYWELLQDTLDEKTSSNLFQLVAEQQQANDRGAHSLLGDEEYGPPTAEPDHPAFVGINQTMSFKPAVQKSGLLEGFSTLKLQEEFLASFPWATESLQRLKRAKPQPSLNLIGTDTEYPPEIQVAVIDYVLLSLDAIGKIVGMEGKLAIQNFNLIKNIVKNIETLSTTLQAFDEVDNLDLLDNLGKMTHILKQQNMLFYDAQNTLGTDVKVEKNPKMNVFCHINELLAHILAKQPYKETLMLPTQPEPPEAEEIDKIRAQYLKKTQPTSRL